ncbi:flagellar protein FliS [Niallia oryzisoli]|uniref:Flagellar protein FliS n=1 Tax=Niallia oryzisoli TaxID=1737571 RepID=A0ABZ2CBR6_9BACI
MDFLTEELIYKKSSQEITSLLYEALLDHLSNSIDDIHTKQYFDANKKLQKVNDILYRLGAGLNYEAGIIADQLDHLYNFMADRVIEANKKKDTAIIQEVISIAERIVGAWNEALKNKPAQKPSPFRQKANAYEKNVMIVERQMNQVEEGK